jgi:undecaprenyl pyrophosphate phosphatase UppP
MWRALFNVGAVVAAVAIFGSALLMVLTRYGVTDVSQERQSLMLAVGAVIAATLALLSLAPVVRSERKRSRFWRNH